jgi:NAD(P)H dehydrogenase (quinone)
MTAKNILIVYAHPEPKSFNAGMVETARVALESAGHLVTVSDLYGEGFDPVAGRHDFASVADPDYFHYQSEQAFAVRNKSFEPDIAREQKRVEDADVLILQFPLWWGGPPAILKGWFERVLAYGFGYVDGARYDTGLFRGRHALLSITTGGPPKRFSPGPEGVYGPIDKVLWQPQRLTLQYLGYEVEEPFIAYAAPRVDEAGRQAYQDELGRRVVAIAAKPSDRGLRPADPLDLVPDNAWAKAR